MSPSLSASIWYGIVFDDPRELEDFEDVVEEYVIEAYDLDVVEYPQEKTPVREDFSSHDEYKKADEEFKKTEPYQRWSDFRSFIREKQKEFLGGVNTIYYGARDSAELALTHENSVTTGRWHPEQITRDDLIVNEERIREELERVCDALDLPYSKPKWYVSAKWF